LKEKKKKKKRRKKNAIKKKKKKMKTLQNMIKKVKTSKNKIPKKKKKKKKRRLYSHGLSFFRLVYLYTYDLFFFLKKKTAPSNGNSSMFPSYVDKMINYASITMLPLLGF
jgi:ATP-dependent Zn protease